MRVDPSYTIKKEFENAMSFARRLVELAKKTKPASGEQHPLLDFVRIMGRGLQAKYLLRTLYTSDEIELPLDFSGIAIDMSISLSPYREVTFYDLVEIVEAGEESFPVCRDLLFPLPWMRKKLLESLAYIGEGRDWGPWRQDDNHDIELWLPLGIAWARSGDHSLVPFLLDEGAEIIPTDVLDISGVYDYVFCDGRYYRRVEDKSVISMVKCAETAILFEVGRLMVENGLPFARG